MPSKKSNHFVPRVHFYPFSKDGQRRAVSLLNLKAMRFVEDASISGQCAKDYFYGKDGELEAWFEKIEGAYGAIVGKLCADCNSLEQAELNFLRDYALLQNLRTEQCLRHDKLARMQMLDLVFHNAEEQKPYHDMSFPSLAASSVSVFQRSVQYIDDLDVCILKNMTEVEFVTSDDPACRVNRLQTRRAGYDGYDTGIMSAGEILVLPLSPRFMMLSYDKKVYRIGGLKGRVTSISLANDVICLNELQQLNALNNVYFSTWDQRDELLSEANRLAAHRRNEKFVIRYAVFDHTEDGAEIFRAIEDMSEVKDGERAMIATHMWALRPTQWPSFLKYRHKPKYLVVGAAKSWMRRNDKEFDATPFYF